MPAIDAPVGNVHVLPLESDAVSVAACAHTAVISMRHAPLVSIAAEGTDAVILLPRTGATDRAVLDPFAHEVVHTSTRAVLIAPPGG